MIERASTPVTDKDDWPKLLFENVPKLVAQVIVNGVHLLRMMRIRSIGHDADDREWPDRIVLPSWILIVVMWKDTLEVPFQISDGGLSEFSVPRTLHKRLLGSEACPL